MGITIIKDKNSNTYTGYYNDFPAVCSQANSKSQLLKNLKRNFNLFTLKE